MPMELTTLRQFLAIAEARHMTRAGEALGVSQPALSAAVKKLEAEVGTPLLDRTGRGVELTEAGRLFAEHAAEAVRRADEGVRAVRELVGLERGQIRVGGGATAAGWLLPPVVRAVRERHPGLHISIREAGSGAVAGAVLDGELDLGIVTLPVRQVGSGELMTVRVLRDELLLIVPPGHALSGRKGFRWSDIAAEAIVGFERGSAVRDVIDRASREHGVELNVVMELRSIGSIQRSVGEGIGVGFVSRHALGEGEGLRCLDGRLVRELGIVRRRDRVPSPAAAAFETELIASGEWKRAG